MCFLAVKVHLCGLEHAIPAREANSGAGSASRGLSRPRFPCPSCPLHEDAPATINHGSELEPHADADDEICRRAIVQILPDWNLHRRFEDVSLGDELDAGRDEQFVVAVGFVEAVEFEDGIQRGGVSGLICFGGEAVDPGGVVLQAIGRARSAAGVECPERIGAECVSADDVRCDAADDGVVGVAGEVAVAAAYFQPAEQVEAGGVGRAEVVAEESEFGEGGKVGDAEVFTSITSRAEVDLTIHRRHVSDQGEFTAQAVDKRRRRDERFDLAVERRRIIRGLEIPELLTDDEVMFRRLERDIGVDRRLCEGR